MIPLLATMFKELLLLVRDRSGLLVLFVMPAVLVVVVSLVQENVLKSTGETAMDILFIDQDHQDFGKRIQKELGESGAVKLVTTLDGQAIDAEQSKTLVEKGRYQVCIVIPPEPPKPYSNGPWTRFPMHSPGNLRRIRELKKPPCRI